MRRCARLFSLLLAGWFVFVMAGIQGLHTHGVGAADTHGGTARGLSAAGVAEKAILTAASLRHNPSTCVACRYLTLVKAGALLPPAVSDVAPAIHPSMGAESPIVAADRLDAQLSRAPPTVSL